MVTLRPYQGDLTQGIRNSFLSQAKAPLAVLPTGGGKTVVFSHIAMNASSRGKRVWILVHRIELLKQTADKLRAFGVPHGLINPKFTPNYAAPVQVASVQTLVNRLNRLPPPDLIVIDEAHHALATTWRTILDAVPNARVLGVTATPCRGDGSGLGAQVGGVFDDVIIGPQVYELIEWGYLVKPIVYAPEARLDLSSVKVKRSGDYDEKALSEVMDKPKITGDAVAHYARLCPGSPAVAFCVSVSHAIHVAEEFRKAGFRAYHADGTLDPETRDRILSGLGNGTVDVVTSCDLISEGTDIPAIGCAILLRPTKSLGLYLQQVGRALRPMYADGYDTSTQEGRLAAIAAGPKPLGAYILDHVGNTLLHGMPDEHREWSLLGDVNRKKKGSAELSMRVTQCERCYAVHVPAPSCPMCGFEYPKPEAAPASGPETVDGQLREVTEADKARMKKERVAKVYAAKTLEELQKVGRELGYKDGWAKHVYASRQAKEAAKEGLM